MRRTILLPILALLAVALIYSAWWFYTGRVAQRAFADWVTVQRSQGYEIGYGSPSLGGFPMRVVLRVPDVTASLPGRFWTASGDGLDISFKPWDFDKYDLKSTGPIRLRSVAVPETLDTPVVINALAGQYRRRPAEGYHAADLLLSDLSGPLGGAAEEIALRAVRPFQRAGTIEDLIGNLTVEAVGVSLPDGLVPVELPRRVDAALLNLEIYGPEPTGGGSTAKRVATWRDAGGLIEIPEIALVWQALNVQGEGTATVDEYMRPELSLAVAVSGLSETARRFEAAGLIDRALREAIEIGTSLLSFGTGGGRIKVPLSIQQGQFYLGPVAVGDVGPILPGPAPPKRLVPAERVERALGEPTLPPPPPPVSGATLAAP